MPGPLVFHDRTKDAVDSCRVSFAKRTQPFEDLAVEPYRYQVLIGTEGGGQLLLCQRRDVGVINFAVRHILKPGEI